MRVLVACEFSGVVRDAFNAIGHTAYSCDLEATEVAGNHYQGDVRRILRADWDMMIAFPPCTCLARSGQWYWKKRPLEIQAAVDFVRELMDAPIPKIAVENPIGVISTRIRKPDQIIQPWQFGHGETKATCLWLKNLPKLTATAVASGREPRILSLGESSTRKRERSRTYTGFAMAMAAQWGGASETAADQEGDSGTYQDVP